MRFRTVAHARHLQEGWHPASSQRPTLSKRKVAPSAASRRLTSPTAGGPSALPSPALQLPACSMLPLAARAARLLARVALPGPAAGGGAAAAGGMGAGPGADGPGAAAGCPGWCGYALLCNGARSATGGSPGGGSAAAGCRGAGTTLPMPAAAGWPDAGACMPQVALRSPCSQAGGPAPAPPQPPTLAGVWGAGPPGAACSGSPNALRGVAGTAGAAGPQAVSGARGVCCWAL